MCVEDVQGHRVIDMELTSVTPRKASIHRGRPDLATSLPDGDPRLRHIPKCSHLEFV